MNFDNVKKTVARRMRLTVKYKSPVADIAYVDKNLIEAQQEYTRLVDAVADCRRLVARGTNARHPAQDMAAFVLSQAISDADAIKTPKELAAELSRLNGILEEARTCMSRSGVADKHTSDIKFALQFKQTSRKRDATKGWNRTALEDDVEEKDRVTADAQVDPQW